MSELFKVVGKSSQRRGRRVFFLALSIVVLVGLALAFAGWRFFANNPNELDATQKKIQEAEQLNEKGETEASLQKYDQFISESSSNEEKARLLKTKGNTCAAQGDFLCALNAYKQADRFVAENAISAFNKAEYARKLKQNEVAKQHYQKAIVLGKKEGGNVSEIVNAAQLYLEELS